MAKGSQSRVSTWRSRSNDVETVIANGVDKGHVFSFSEWFSVLDPKHPISDHIHNRFRILVRLLDVTLTPCTEDVME